MALNPRIILSGIQADVPGSFQRGLQFADEQRQFQERRENAPLRRQAAEQAVELGEQQIGAGDRERELGLARSALALIKFADTPEKWDQAAQKLGLPDQVGNFADRDNLMAISEVVVDAMSTPAKQSVFGEKMAALKAGGLDDRQALERLIPGRQARAGRAPSAYAEKLADLSMFMPREEAVRLLTQKGGFNISIGGESFDFGGDESGEPDPDVDDSDVDAVDTGRGLGLGGAARNAFNKAGDFLGLGQFWPETAQAADNLTFLKTRFLFATRNMINQRMSNQMLDLVDTLTVSPGGILGRDGAIIRLENGLKLVEDNIAGLQRVSDNRLGKFSKKAVSDATQDGILLTNLQQEYIAVIDTLAPRETQAAPGTGGQAAEPQEPPPQSAVDDGVTPNQWQLMTPEQRALWQN